MSSQKKDLHKHANFLQYNQRPTPLFHLSGSMEPPAPKLPHVTHSWRHGDGWVLSTQKMRIKTRCSNGIGQVQVHVLVATVTEYAQRTQRGTRADSF